jgi:hypothetical protein
VQINCYDQRDHCDEKDRPDFHHCVANLPTGCV